jgi:hypothetical protein
MKTHKNVTRKICVLMWLISTALFASGSSVQSQQPTWLLLQRENSEATEFDEYKNIRFNDEKARLDAYGIHLQQDPRVQGYIIGYGGRICRPNEAKARARRAANYLINTRQIDAGRVVTMDGGYRDELEVELYLVPLGASRPSAAPSVPKCIKARTASKTRSRRR